MRDYEKYVQRLEPKKKRMLRDTVVQILSKKWENLDISPYMGKKGWYRCRKGDIRIIFSIEDANIFIKGIGPRGDVYKGI